MPRIELRSLVAAVTLLVASTDAFAMSLDAAIAGAHRDPANTARDQYRHPKATLEFFGLEPDMTVVEVWPSGGWWTEILAPVLRDDGSYVAAGFVTEGNAPKYQKDLQKGLADKLAAQPALYERAVLTEIGVPGHTNVVPDGTADLVLTFRNVHNWLAGDTADAMFGAFAKMLRAGGVLGVEEHRAPEGTSLEVMKQSGYMTESKVIELAKTAGLELVAKSEINANPKDTADYPEGVWTLPPNLRVCRPMPAGPAQDECFAKYRAIGESDRMTLKFRKPG
jgi:predicted methyltransferase